MTALRQYEPDWLYDQPVINDRSSWTLGETEHYFVDLLPMLYNHRVVLTPKTCLYAYDVGWCYPTREAALLAVILWHDPEGSEPVGAIKRVGAAWPMT